MKISGLLKSGSHRLGNSSRERIYIQGLTKIFMTRTFSFCSKGLVAYPQNRGLVRLQQRSIVQRENYVCISLTVYTEKKGHNEHNLNSKLRKAAKERLKIQTVKQKDHVN